VTVLRVIKNTPVDAPTSVATTYTCQWVENAAMSPKSTTSPACASNNTPRRPYTSDAWPRRGLETTSTTESRVERAPVTAAAVDAEPPRAVRRSCGRTGTTMARASACNTATTRA